MQFIPTDKQIIDALRYMGIPPGGQTEELARTVAEAFGKLEACIEPRCVWGRFHIIHFDGGIELEGAYIYSDDIARLTSRSTDCIVIAATLGHETDRQITLAQNRNMLDGLALDACASVMIDSYIDEYLRSDIAGWLRPGERMTSRFSPGYGDLSMNVTDDIITILNATKRIGLSVTRSMMMSPVKSVTAIAGLFMKQG
ncbi:MAG: methionine synthase [Synergistaceae bacterium]|nr:methionine synthase [Synergistaceae bacterium]